MKKIDIFYRDGKGNYHYLHSTNAYKRCRDAVKGCILYWERWPYTRRISEKEVGEAINEIRLSGRFDHEKN